MKVSIVVASGAGGDFLLRCLESLREQAIMKDVEVIVPDRCSEARVAQLSNRFPFINAFHVRLDHRPSVPELRRLGVECAQGEVVAIIEEHCIAPYDWLETIEGSFQPSDAAIGGPILDDHYSRLQDWVVYLSEYHNYFPPWLDGPRYQLNGANIVYSRNLLMKHRPVLDSGYWEVVLHPLLAKEGAFRSVSKMRVKHTGPFDFRYYLRQRFLLSRVWGAGQRYKTGITRRLLHIILAPVFPALLLARIAQRSLNSKVYFSKFLATLPLLIPVTIAYTLGETIGYLTGVGSALEQVE